jgi:cytochrome P450
LFDHPDREVRGLALDLWDERSGALMMTRGAPKWGLDDRNNAPPWGDHEEIRAIKGQLDCRAALSHPGLTSRVGNGILRQSDSNLVFLEGDRHKRLRSLIGHTLPARQSASESSGAFVEGLLGRLPTSAQIDIVNDFAVPIAEDMSLTILGLPADGHEPVAPLLSSMSAQFDPSSDEAALARATDAVHHFLSLVRLTVRQKTYSPGGALDLLNQARLAGDLSLREMLGSAMMLAHASFQNSVNMISFAAVESMTNPALHEAVRTAGPAAQRSWVEELLRLGSPARFLGRRAEIDMTVGSTKIAAKDLVIPFIAEANRDPTVFDQPDEFDPSRIVASHLAFGAGAHFCLGAAVARAELLATIRGLTGKYRTLTFDAATWGTNMVMFGPTSFVVRLAG